MTVHFAPATATFHDARLGPLPDGAVPIDAACHARLLAARTAGKTIVAGADGHPVAVAPPAPPLDRRRARAIASVKGEATARILAIAPIWRQLNDARDLPGATGAARAAIEARFSAIDAVRAASDALEARIATMSARGLTQLDIAAPSHWPA